MLFDVLELDGERVMDRPYADRRPLLDELGLRSGPWVVADAFEDGAALFAAACERGLEGVVVKRRSERYRPGERAWIKVKNRSSWRYGEELEALQKEHRAEAAPSCSRALT